MEFLGPLPDKSLYFAKFLVVGERVFVTAPGDDLEGKHVDLFEEAKESGDLEEDINPPYLDAGRMRIINVGQSMRSINLYDRSTSMDLPERDTAKEARAHSVTVFQRLSPGYEVIGEPPYNK